MKVVFKETSNESFKCLKGYEGELSIGLTIFFHFEPDENTPFDFRRGDFRSSVINSYVSKEISRGCYELTFQTNNSEYIFVYGTYDETKKPYTDEERMAIGMSMIF